MIYEFLESVVTRLDAWLVYLFDIQVTLPLILQFVVLLFVWLIGYVFGTKTSHLLDRIARRQSSSTVRKLINIVSHSATVIVALFALIMFYAAGSEIPEVTSLPLLHISIDLLLAWLIIQMLSHFITNKDTAKSVAIIVWSIAALSITGILDPILNQLESISLTIGEAKLSLLSVTKGLVLLIVFLWLATAVSKLAEGRLKKSKNLTPSLQVLFAKVIRITLIIIAFVVALNTFGIDLTAFAVFSGAVGVGVGFGLQKVVSNFISGIILLLDNSIKPGDVVVIDNTYGWVNSLSARYVSVITRDGKEHLIPNELLITEKVENWSYSDNNVRLRIPFGVAYESDVEKVIELVEAVTMENKRVLEAPKPVCMLSEFGDSSINFQLRVWIKDPTNGIGNIKSELLIAIWKTFKAHDINIPFPQRDLHIVSDATKS